MTTVRIWFEKRGEASYISLLDLQRVMQRVFKRSRIPVWHTLGFNPHIYMTFGCPLPLGQESLCENVDIKTEAENPDYAEWKAALNALMPVGIHVLRVEPAGMKADEIGFAEYKVNYRSQKALEAIEQYNAADVALVQKKSKKGMKELDLKQAIPHIDVQPTTEGISFVVKVPTSSQLTVNPALLTAYFEQNNGLPAADASILRTALYTKEGEVFC